MALFNEKLSFVNACTANPHSEGLYETGSPDKGVSAQGNGSIVSLARVFK
jgi:hypothetical protein